MNINTEALVSMTEANQNFSKVTRMVEKFGSAVILKNNVPKYIVINFEQVNQMEEASDEEVMALSLKYLAENKEVYEALAK